MFERKLQAELPEYYEKCKAAMRHKFVLVSPTLLKTWAIPFNKIVQKEGKYKLIYIKIRYKI